MTASDDPFSTNTDPANVYSPYEVEHTRPLPMYNRLSTGHSEHSQRRQVYNPREGLQREERGREARRPRYEDSGVDAQVFYPASACVFVAK